MCPGAVVILLVRAQHMPQMSLAEHDHMIEALASDGAEKSFSVTVLPRRSRRCRSVANDPSLQMLSDGQRHISCFHVPGDVFGLERTATHRMAAEALEDSQ